MKYTTCWYPNWESLMVHLASHWLVIFPNIDPFVAWCPEAVMKRDGPQPNLEARLRWLQFDLEKDPCSVMICLNFCPKHLWEALSEQTISENLKRSTEWLCKCVGMGFSVRADWNWSSRKCDARHVARPGLACGMLWIWLRSNMTMTWGVATPVTSKGWIFGVPNCYH